MDQRTREAISKIINGLKKLGFDPYVDVDKDYMAVIIPTAQLAQVIHRNIGTFEVTQHVNMEVKEITAGNKGYIVIKATPKAQNKP